MKRIRDVTIVRYFPDRGHRLEGTTFLGGVHMDTEAVAMTPLDCLATIVSDANVRPSECLATS